MVLTLLPSAVKQFVAWASAQTDLAALHGGRVGTKLGATLPAIRVQRIGGIPEDVWEDHPLLQAECWGATEGAADDLARTLVAALPLFRGTFSDGKVYAAAVESYLWMPDDPKLSADSRYLLTIRLISTP